MAWATGGCFDRGLPVSMGLRRQLLLFGCLSLALPWAGVQYVREMESALRQGHGMALQATAQAVAARLRSDEALLQLAREQNASGVEWPSDVIYAHATAAPLPVDGYDDDWRNLDLAWQQAQAIGNFSMPPKMVAAKRGDSLHLLIAVADPSRQFFDPAVGPATADRIELYAAADDPSSPLRMRLYTAAPGPVLAELLSVEGVWQRDYRVQAVWNEREDAFFVELKLPFQLAEQGLAVTAIDGSASQAERGSPPLLRWLVTRSAPLDAMLETFSQTGVRLHLINRDDWIIGRAGALLGADEARGLAFWQRQWLRALVGPAEFPALDYVARRGRFYHEQQPIAVTAATNWYRYNEGLVGRVVQPVVDAHGELVAAVVAEQTTDSIEQLTSGAAGRLLLYSLGASLLAAAGLLGFASVLSYRVRKLSLQVQAAVDRDGRIVSTFRGSGRRDELGDLSRQYAALVERLRNYTQYLETLASKLSHELRTPLAVVRTSLDNLAHEPLSSAARVYAARASGGSERLSAILNSMSAAARLEQSIHRSDKEWVDLKQMLPHVVDSYNGLYDSTTVTLHIEGEHDAMVLVAPELFVQMLDKLVENAVDFAATGSEVEVRLLCRLKSVILQVINEGPAIAPKMLTTIFDSMVSIRERENEGQHLGLGLYVVRLIAQFHHAQLRAVNDNLGKVRFEVILPRARQ